MNNNSEDMEHCVQCGPTYDYETGESDDSGIECVCCECCCDCMGCLYGPRDSVPMTAEQRAPIAALGYDVDVPPNAGSAS